LKEAELALLEYHAQRCRALLINGDFIDHERRLAVDSLASLTKWIRKMMKSG